MRLSFAAALLLVVCSAHAVPNISVTIDTSKYAAAGSTGMCTISATDPRPTFILMTYTLPAGVTFSGVSPTGSLSCATPVAGVSGRVSCFSTDSAFRTFTVFFSIPSFMTPGTVLTHSVNATGDRLHLGNASATATSVVQPLPDVTLTTNHPASTVSGRPYQYSVIVANGGANPSGPIRFRAFASTRGAREAWYSVVSQLSGPAFHCSLSTPQPTAMVECGGNALASGESAEIVLTATPHPSLTSGMRERKEELIFDDYGASTSTKETSANRQVDDVVVTGSAPAQIESGDDLAYAIDVRSAGPSAASNVSFTWTAPPGTAFLSLAVEKHGLRTTPSCSTPVAGGSGPVTCTIPQLLPEVAALQTPADVARVVVHARAPFVAGSVTNSVTATAANDPNAANNSSSAITTVVVPTSVDFSVTMAPSKGTAVIGSEIFYVTTVQNSGPAAVRNVRVSISWTPEATITARSATCTNGVPVVCTIETLAAGQSENITVGLTASTSGTKTVTATVSSDASDPNSANDDASATVVVLPRTSDLAVTATASPMVLSPGEAVTYQATVTASGPDPVLGTLTVSSETSLTIASPDVSCSGNGSVKVQCIALFEPGSSQTFVFTSAALAGSALPGGFTTTFDVRTPDLDPDLSNNAVSVTPVIAGASGAGIAIEPPVVNVFASQPFEFTIRLFSNDSLFHPLVVTIPGWSLVSATPSQGGGCGIVTFGYGTAELICNVGSVGPGVSPTIRITGVASPFPGRRAYQVSVFDDVGQSPQLLFVTAVVNTILPPHRRASGQ